MRNVVALLIALCCCAAGPTTVPVFTNIDAPGTHRFAWANPGITGAFTDSGLAERNATAPVPQLAYWRAFASAVRDNKPLPMTWGPTYHAWDARTEGLFLDAEGVTSGPFSLTDKVNYMTTVTRSVRAVAPKLQTIWYDDYGAIFWGRTAYPWSAQILSEANYRRDTTRRLHSLCDFVLIGGYLWGDNLASPAAWTKACQNARDHAALNRLVFADQKILYLQMGWANPAWSRPKRPDETESDYRAALAPTVDQIAEFREAIAPYVDGVFVWSGEDPPTDETRRMIRGFRYAMP